MKRWTSLFLLATCIGLTSPAFGWIFDGTHLFSTPYGAHHVEIFPDGTGGFLVGAVIAKPAGPYLVPCRVASNGDSIWIRDTGGRSFAGDGLGGVFTLEERPYGNSTDSLILRHRAPSGAAVDYGAGGSVVYQNPSTTILRGSVASDDEGGVYILEADFWTDPPPVNGRILVWRYRNGQQLPSWPRGAGPLVPAQYPFRFVAVPDGAHGLIIGSWIIDATDIFSYKHSMMVTRMAPTGAVTWSSLATTQHSTGEHPLGLLRSDDHVFFCWRDGGGTNRGVRIQCLDLATGGVRTGWPADGIAVVQGHRDSLFAMLGSDGVGGVYVAWSRGSEVRAIRYNGDGTLAPGWPVEGVDLLGPGAVPSFSYQLETEAPGVATFAIASSVDGLITCWTDRRNPVSWVPLARWLLPDGSPDPAQNNAGVQVCPAGAIIKNAISDGNRGAYVGWWIGNVGARVDVHVGWLPYSNPWIGVRDFPPPASSMSLRAWPNPARDALQVQFRVSDAMPVLLELVDVTGQRVRSLDSRAMGEQTLRFEHLDELPAGVYFVRMQQGSVSRSQRVALLH